MSRKITAAILIICVVFGVWLVAHLGVHATQSRDFSAKALQPTELVDRRAPASTRIVEGSARPDRVMRRALSHYMIDGNWESLMATLPTSLANMSLSELINVAKETPFRGDGMAVLHQVAEAFGRRADGKSVRQLIEVYSTGSSDSERERLGFLVRRIGSKEGLDALQQFVTSLEVSQASNLDALITFAAFALAVSGDGTRTNALLTAAARSTGSARLSLFDGAEHIESLEALPILISVADRSHPLAGDKDVLTMSIYLLGRIRSEKSRDKLQQLVSSGDPTIAQWAKEAEENLRSIAPGLYGSE